MAVVPMLSTIADQTASQIAGAASALMPSGVILPFGGATFSASGTTPAETLASSTVAAQAITVGAGDTETTPAAISLNYIIKL